VKDIVNKVHVTLHLVFCGHELNVTESEVSLSDSLNIANSDIKFF